MQPDDNTQTNFQAPTGSDSPQILSSQPLGSPLSQGSTAPTRSKWLNGKNVIYALPLILAIVASGILYGNAAPLLLLAVIYPPWWFVFSRFYQQRHNIDKEVPSTSAQPASASTPIARRSRWKLYSLGWMIALIGLLITVINVSMLIPPKNYIRTTATASRRTTGSGNITLTFTDGNGKIQQTDYDPLMFNGSGSNANISSNHPKLIAGNTVPIAYNPSAPLDNLRVLAIDNILNTVSFAFITVYLSVYLAKRRQKQ